jgi:hypothetical protein
MTRISNRSQDPRPDERGYPPVTSVEPDTETTRRASRPRDPQGLPMLTAGDVAPDLGITDPNNYKHAAYGEVPHYIDTKSGNLTSTSNNRVWFALQDVVNHFAVKSGAGKAPETKSASELAHASRHEHWHKVHQQALKQEEVNKNNGINNGNLWNQPDIANKDIHRRMVYGVRKQVEDDPATGDLVGRVIGLGPNIANPVSNGSMKPVGGTSDEVIDFSNPNRPRRR